MVVLEPELGNRAGHIVVPIMSDRTTAIAHISDPLIDGAGRVNARQVPAAARGSAA